MNHLGKRSLSLIMAILMVLAMIPANPVHVHAEEAATVIDEVTIGDGLSVMTGQSINDSFNAYPVSKGATFAVKLTNKDAFYYGGYNGVITVEVEYLLASASTGSTTIKEDFKFAYGAAGTSVKEVTKPTYYKPGTKATSKIAVYELSGAALDGSFSSAANIAVMLQNTTDAFVGICSIKITKGIDNAPLTNNAESIETAYCSKVVLPAITVTNTSETFAKNLFVKGTVTREGAANPIFNNAPLKTGEAVQPGDTVPLVDLAAYANHFATFGTYTVTLTGYWNYDDADHKIDITVTFERKNGHNYVEGTTTSPSCTEDGYTTYTCACGATEQRDPVSATGHKAGEVQVENNVPATCEEAGSYDNVTYCTVCGEESSRQTITVNALGHQAKDEWSADDVYHWYDCVNGCGLKYQKAIHEGEGWVEDNDQTHSQECTICHHVTTKAHNWVDATCAAPKHCSDCGATEGEALEHSLTWVALDDLKCCQKCENCSYTTTAQTHDGKWQPVEGTNNHTATCTRCEHVVTKEHIAGEVKTENVQAPTCGEAGSHDEVIYCTECKVELSRETKEDAATNAHTWTDATCTAPKTCTGCGKTEGEALDHDLELVNDSQYHWYDCTRCDYNTAAAEHTGKWYPVEGENKHTATCEVCNYVDAQEHTFVAGTVVAPTCTEDGFTVYTCVCGAMEFREPVPATGHVNGDSVRQNEVPKTCETNGSYDYVTFCANCGIEISRETIINYAPGHQGAEEWSSDDTYHWKVCINGCNQRAYEAVHEGEGWVEDNDQTHSQECTICHHVTTKAHKWVDATCTVPKHCSDCGATEGEALGHDLELVNDSQYHWYECTRCDYNTVAAEHTGKWNPVEGGDKHTATCSACGFTQEKEHDLKWETTDAQHRQKCETCGFTTEAENHTGKWTPVEGEDQHTVTCTKCEYVLNQPHVWVKGETVDPTVDAEGYTNYSCSVCKATKKDDIQDALPVVAKIGETGYPSLADAVAAANAGDTITLQTDNAEDIELAKAVVLDVNGNTYTGTVTLTDAAAALTIPEGQTVVSGVEAYYVDYKDGSYYLAQYVAQNVNTGKYYTSVNDGLDEAVANDTIIMLANDAAHITYIPADITLNLNGFTYTATYMAVFNGGNVVDNSQSNTGLLVVDPNRLMINEKNAQLPVKTEAGYMFVEILGFAEKWGKNDYYIAQLYVEAAARELLKGDLAAANVSVYVRVSWTNSQGLKRSQDFEYSNEKITEYFNSYDASTGKYDRQIFLDLTGTDENTQFTYQVVVASDLGVEFTSNGYTK